MPLVLPITLFRSGNKDILDFFQKKTHNSSYVSELLKVIQLTTNTGILILGLKQIAPDIDDSPKIQTIYYAIQQLLHVVFLLITFSPIY